MFAPQTRAAYLLLIPSTGCYFGTPVTLHQKQPLTKIAVLYLRITMSGLPGTLLTFSLYRYPCAHSHFLTVISGFVALLRICDMQRWRFNYYLSQSIFLPAQCTMVVGHELVAPKSA